MILLAIVSIGTKGCIDYVPNTEEGSVRMCRKPERNRFFYDSVNFKKPTPVKCQHAASLIVV
jgi:hypothetical protein